MHFGCHVERSEAGRTVAFTASLESLFLALLSTLLTFLFPFRRKEAAKEQGIEQKRDRAHPEHRSHTQKCGKLSAGERPHKDAQGLAGKVGA